MCECKKNDKYEVCLAVSFLRYKLELGLMAVYSELSASGTKRGVRSLPNKTVSS